MKKTIMALVLTIILCTGVAYAAEPVDHTVTVTVDDITLVSEQLKDYEEDIDMIAQLIWAEARGVDSTMEQAAVAWCVLNRYDAGYGFSISDVITSPSQFAYRRGLPVLDKFRELAKDVLTRWLLEKQGIEDVGRVLPEDYLYFAGSHGANRFRTGYSSRTYWDWSLPDPYDDTL